MKTRVIILISVLVLVTVGIHIVLFKPLADQWSQVAEDTGQSLPKYKTIITDYDPEGVVATTRKMRRDVVEQMSEYDRLRERYGFEGTPLRLRFRGKDPKDTPRK